MLNIDGTGRIPFQVELHYLPQSSRVKRGMFGVDDGVTHSRSERRCVT